MVLKFVFINYCVSTMLTIKVLLLLDQHPPFPGPSKQLILRRREACAKVASSVSLVAYRTFIFC